MEVRNFLFYTFLLVFVFLACRPNQQQATKTQGDGVISIETFNEAISKINSPQLIDVRTPKEYGGGHLDGATNINFNGSDFDQSIGQLDKAQPVFIYCQSGGRSGKAYKKLKTMGFTTVYDLKGGYGSLQLK